MTVAQILKKAEQLIEERRQSDVAYLARTLLPAGDSEALELDELWSFAGNQGNQVWV